MNTNQIFHQNRTASCRELRERKIILSSKPRALNVALTTRCNLACRMCEVRKISWEAPQKTINEITKLFPYLEKIVWQGGEVFLLDYFKEVLEKAAHYPDLKHEITTSGHLITEEWIEKFNRIKIDLNISIDGVTKETYEHIRKGSTFQGLLKTLKLINTLKEKGRKQVLVLIVTVMKSNYFQLEHFVDFAHKYGFNRLILQPLKGNYENEENIFFHNDREALEHIDQVKPQMKKEAEECGIELVEWLPAPPEIFSSPQKDNLPQSSNIKDKDIFCYAPWQQLFIEWGGKIYPYCLCLQDGPNENKEVGNVFDSTLEEVWNGQKMQIFRKKLIDNDLTNLCNPDCLNGLIEKGVRSLPLEL